MDYLINVDLLLHSVRHVKKQQLECQHRVRVGDADDGGWDMCIAGLYKPTHNCLVYDFGWVQF